MLQLWTNDLLPYHLTHFVYFSTFFGGACGVMVIVVGNGHGESSSNPDETNCISHSINTLGKGINPIILPPAMGK